jgi:hypothetical protein
MYDGTLRTRAPWQALVTFQQMLILCDPTGVCDMTAEALAFRTGIPLEFIQAGIAALEAPDPDSRLPNDEGRRIVRLDDHRNWGWRVTNFVHYRDLQSNEARREYQRKWLQDQRAAKKKTASAARLSTIDDTCRQVMTSDDDVYTRRRRRSNPICANPEGFALFYAAYPRKKGPSKAQAAWTKLCPDAALETKIRAALEIQKQEWLRDGTLAKHIPYPASWLNGKRWEDEVEDAAVARRENSEHGNRHPGII